MTKKRLLDLGGWWIVDGMIRLPDGRIYDRDYDMARRRYLKTWSLRCYAS